jgi:hypothetical protein
MCSASVDMLYIAVWDILLRCGGYVPSPGNCVEVLVGGVNLFLLQDLFIPQALPPQRRLGYLASANLCL